MFSPVACSAFYPVRRPLVVCIVGHDAILQFVGVSQLRSTSLEWYGQVFQLLTIARETSVSCVYSRT